MTRKIKLEVPQELMTEVQSLDDGSLAARCDDEIGKHIEYLETVLKGWKTYKNVQREYRSVLLLMLKSDNKDSLHDYERLVLYPKMAEKEKAKRSRKERVNPIDTKIIGCADSVTSVAELGADSGDCSTGEESGSQSPVREHPHDQPIVYERVDVPEIIIENVDEAPDNKLLVNNNVQTNRAEQNIPQKNIVLGTNIISVKDAEQATSNRCYEEPQGKSISLQNLNKLRDLVDHVEYVETAETTEHPEDETVVGVSFEKLLSQHILHASKQVRLALDTVEKKRSEAHNDMNKTDAVTKMQLRQLESKLIESASEVSAAEEKMNISNLSKGTKKRAKKAAKKAAQVAEAERKIIEERENRIRQATLAAEALTMIPTVEANKQEPRKLAELPLTEEELQLLVKVTKSDKMEYEPNSKEEKVLKKYAANKSLLEEHLRKNLTLEAEYGVLIRKQIQELTNEIQGVPSQKPKTKEEELEEARSYIIEKLEFWKNSSDPQAQHYADMYQHLLNNCGYTIASLIVSYKPYEKHQNIEVERTMLLQYQAGNFFRKKENDIQS